MKTRHSWQEIRDYIISDLYRETGRKHSVYYALYYALRHRYRSAGIMFWFRLAQCGGILGFIGKRRWLEMSHKCNVDIPLETEIGYGLYLGHSMCIVVSSLTKIGNNCNISQFCNIGSNEGRGAVIGDNVYLGPQVCIVEDVKIGNNATIGAGAVVTRDIADDATAVGVPARAVNYNNPGRYIGNRWNVSDNNGATSQQEGTRI